MLQWEENEGVGGRWEESGWKTRVEKSPRYIRVPSVRKDHSQAIVRNCTTTPSEERENIPINSILYVLVYVISLFCSSGIRLTRHEVDFDLPLDRGARIRSDPDPSYAP